MFETNSEKEFDKEQIGNLEDIFQDLSDEFSDEISLSVRRYSNSPAIVFYSIDIDYGKLLFYAYSYKRREGIKDRSVFINKMCEYSLKLSNFWKILNECLIRLNSNGDFTFTDDDSSLDDSSFLGEKMRIVVAYKK